MQILTSIIWAGTLQQLKPITADTDFHMDCQAIRTGVYPILCLKILANTYTK